MFTGDTIVAIATAPGMGGVGIVRVSGSSVVTIAETILGKLPTPRLAEYHRFLDSGGQLIDQGIALYFPRPRSFTGEDILELQGHGGPVVLDLLLQRVLSLGARLARPGEFSERAFINGKIDLTQAEAIADLIESGNASAARLASRSLEGVFSSRIKDLTDALAQLRMYVEAAIDFPEEEVDFLSEKKVDEEIVSVIDNLRAVKESARIGRVMRDGMYLVLAGLPNAGKSSLMNALAGRETAIVSEIPGTTRDLLREQIEIDGMPIHLIDTAGLREGGNPVEQEGIRRAEEEIKRADLVLWVFDDQLDKSTQTLIVQRLPENVPISFVRNKIDLTGKSPAITINYDGFINIALSAKTGLGIELLRNHLKDRMNYQGPQEGEFIARRRHLDALQRAEIHLETGREVLLVARAEELLAEELRQAHKALGEITGEITSDDLLGRIFSSFCIGK